MKYKAWFIRPLLCFVAIISFSSVLQAQVDDEELGAWYMYFYDAAFGSGKFGVQGDIQYRAWDKAGDMEQLMLRSGFTYRPSSAIKLTLGYANITSGAYGESDATINESRIYQEALIPNKVSERLLLNHRFRYEQRFVEGQDFRTRYRYNLFVTIPITKRMMNVKGVYVALYNELFVNGQRNIGDGISVALFDRNRFYGALGYVLTDQLKVQAGMMRQTTNTFGKDQIQLSLHHTIGVE